MRPAVYYFGGKHRVAGGVWERLGDTTAYIEPFCGSASVLLARPPCHERRHEVINDLDGFVVNFYRAVRAAPEEVARHADWPVSQLDYLARHAWLQARRRDWAARLRDPEWYDARAAGWWCWGANLSIGNGWGRGYLLNTRPHVGRRRGLRREADPVAYLRQLAERLRPVTILCTDWRRAVTACLTDELAPGQGDTVGIFFDAPYRWASGRQARLYAED